MPPKQPNNKSAKKQQSSQRTRLTNKALEARQFSSVRMPRSSELPQQKINVEELYAEQHGELHHAGAAASASPAQAAARATTGTAASSSTFDPIPNDPMFIVVANSTYWPPPSLEELQRITGVNVSGTDGFDSYDRAADDQRAKKEKTKLVKGELNHPRGKPRQNVIVQLSGSDEDKSDADENEEKA